MKSWGAGQPAPPNLWESAMSTSTPTPTPKPDWVGGVVTAMVFTFVFGLFIGLPVFVWFILVIATIILVAAYRNHNRPSPFRDRPWERKD